MEGKKKYIIAIILFIFLGLMIFTFANPSNDEDTSLDGKDKTKENVNKKDNAKDSEDTSDSDALNNDNTITNGSLTTNSNANTSRKTNTTTTTQTVATADTTYEEALKAVVEAEGKITQEALEHASGLVGQVTDEGKKQELEDRLEALDNSLEVKGLVEELASQVNSAKNKGAMNNARSFRTNKEVVKRVGELKSPYEGLQKELQDTLNSLAKLLDDTDDPELNVVDGAMFNKKNVPVTVSAEDKNEVTITVKDEAGNEVEMPLEKDGKYTITAEDAAHNEVGPITIEIDTLAPEYKTLGLLNLTNYVAQEGSLNYAKVGDQIRVYLEFSEKLGKEAEVEINGKKETLTYREPSSNEEDSRYVYMADFTVDETYAEGEVKFTITGYEDVAGNEGNKLTEEDINHKTYSGVIVDKTAAKRTAANMLVAGKSNEKDGPVYYASAESKIYTYVTFNEQLKENPTYVLINNGKEIDVTNKVKESKDEKTGKYTYSVTVPVSELEGFSDGEVTFKVSNIKDKAGNETKDVTATTNGHKVIIDTIAPKVWVDDKEDSAEIIDGVAYTTSGNANTNVHDANPFTFTIKDSKGKEVKTLSYKYAPGEWYGNKDYAFRAGISHLIKENKEYTIIATDGAGNKTEYKFYWDKTAAKLTAANMLVAGKSNEKDGPVYYANAESKINTYVTFNEQLKENPTYVLINNGKEIDVTAKVKESKDEKTGKYTYSVTVPVSELAGFTDGEVTFKVSNIQDKIGNKTADVTATTNGHQVIIDTIAPVVYAGSKAGEATLKEDVHYTNNGGANVDVRDANPFTMVVTDSEEKEVLTREGTAKDGKYYFRGGIGYTIKENKVYTVTATDKAGNKTVYKFAWDKTAPEATQVTMNNNTRLNEGVDAKSAKVGDWIWIYATFNEELRETPSLKLGGNEGTLAYSSLNENNSGLYTYVMQVNLPAGIASDGENVPFTITNIYDALGNKAEDITATIGETSTWLVVDNTKSTVYVGTPKNNNGYESVEYNGVVYTRDKNVNVKDANPFTFVVKDAEGNIVSPAKGKTNAGEYNEKTKKYEFRKQIHVKDGAYTVVVTDEAGNVQEYAYTLDTTIPEITTISVAADGKTLTDEGRRIQLKDNTYYTYEIKNSEGKVVRDLKDKETKEVIYEQAGSMKLDYLPDGEYTITVTDIAGNVATKTFAIDNTKATIEEFRIQKHPSYSKTKDETYATIDDQVYITVKTSEELASDPELYIGETKIGTAKKQTDGTNKYVLYNVKLTEELGLTSGEKIPVTIKGMIDKAGNVSEDITKTENKEGKYYVIFDNTAIVDYNVEYQVWNDKKVVDDENGITYVTTGSDLAVMVMYEEKPSQDPVMTIAGIPAKVANQSTTVNGVDYYKYVGTLTIPEDIELKSGDEIPFEITATDAAGNETTSKVLTKGNKLVLDTEAPSLIVDGVVYSPSTEGTINAITPIKSNGEADGSATFSGVDELSGYAGIWGHDADKNPILQSSYRRAYGYTYPIKAEDKLGNTHTYYVYVIKNTATEIEKSLKNITDNSTLTLPKSEINGNFEIDAKNVTIVGSEGSTINGNIVLKGEGATLKDVNMSNNNLALEIRAENVTIDGGNYSVHAEDDGVQGAGAIKAYDVCNISVHNTVLHGALHLINYCGSTVDISDNEINLDYEGPTALVGLLITTKENNRSYTAQGLYESNTINIKNEPNSYYTAIQDADTWKDIEYVKVGGYQEIATPEALRDLSANPTNYKDKVVVLTDDIDLAGKNWTPINAYSNNMNGLVIDGKGHTIKNMTVNTNEEAAGFFDNVASNITIKNLNFDNASVIQSEPSNHYAGILIGKTYSNLTISGVNVTNSHVENHWQLGGLVGFGEFVEVTFDDCHVSDSFFGGSDASAGVFFGLGRSDVIVKNSSSANIKLYTDGLTYESTQKLQGNYFVGHLYDHSLTVENSTESNVTVVNEVTPTVSQPNTQPAEDTPKDEEKEEEVTPSMYMMPAESISEEGVVLEDFPYATQEYSEGETTKTYTTKEITVKSDNDAGYKEFLASHNYQPVNVIWWAEFKCDNTMCVGFNDRGANKKSEKIIEGRRGDVSITMEAPEAKDGYKFVRWEAYTADYSGMKIQGFEAIYEEETTSEETTVKDIVVDSLATSLISLFSAMLRF